MKNNKLVKSIGDAKEWMYQSRKPKAKKEHSFVRKTYCSDCVATHEIGKHMEGGEY